MKIINEKGKLFGIINIVDLAVLLVILLIAFAAAVKLTGGEIKTPITGAKKNVTITLKAPSKSDALLTAFNKGDQLMYGNLFIDGAYIQKVELTPTMVTVPLPTGEVVKAQDPILNDINITFTAPVTTDSNVIKIGGAEIRIGATYVINTRNAQAACYVTGIEYDK